MVLLAVISGGIGALLGLVGLSYLRAYWTITGTEPTDVAAVSDTMDEVALMGTAMAVGEPGTAPFSASETLVCDWDFDDLGGDQGKWSTVESGAEVAPFVLADETGEIVVDPRGADWQLDQRFQVTIHDEEPPQAIRSFLDEQGMEPNAEKRLLKDDRRYTERRLDPGDEVYVYGPVKRGPAEDAPSGTVESYIGTDSADADNIAGQASMTAQRDILPFVGDSKGTLSIGGAEESSLFTLAVADGSIPTDQYRKYGLFLFLFGLTFVGIGIALLMT